MRASTVIRLALFTLAIMVGLAILFNLLLASAVERARRPPVVAAAAVEDRVYLAHASSLQRRPGGDANYDLTAIPSAKAFEALRLAAEGEENEEEDGDSPDPREAWIEAATLPGNLRGMTEADGRLLKAFDGSLLLLPPPTEADELLPANPRLRERIRTHLATRDMPREEFARLVGTTLSDVDVLPQAPQQAAHESEADEAPETNAKEADDATTDSPQTAPRAGDATTPVLLTYAGRDRVVRLAFTEAAEPAEPLGPPAFFAYDPETDRLSVSAVEPDPPGKESAAAANAPTQSRAGGANNSAGGSGMARDVTADDLEERADEADAPRVRVYAADSLQRYDADAPEQRADVLVWLATRKSSDGGGGLFGSGGSEEWTPRLVWLALRDGEWREPLEIGTRVDYFRSVFEPDTSFVHVLYHYETGEGDREWRYQRLDLEATRIRAPAAKLAWPGDSPRQTDPFAAAWVDGRVHLFMLNPSGGGVTHAATQPLAELDSPPREVRIAHTAAVPAFAVTSPADLDLGWWIIGTTLLGMLLVLFVMFLHVRNQQAQAAAPDITRFGQGSEKQGDSKGAAQGSSPAVPDDTSGDDASVGTEASKKEPETKRAKPESHEPQQGPPLDPFDVGAILERFGYHPAGPFVRFFALVADLLILVVPLYLIAGFAGLNIEDLGWPTEPDFWRLYFLFWGMQFAYFFLLEYYWGTTPGKKLFGLRLRNPERTAKRLEWPALMWRNLMRGIDYPLFVVMFFSDRWQRLGDRLGGTVVVRDSDQEEPGNEKE